MYIVRITGNLFYQRRGYSHRRVVAAQADRMSLDHATDTAARVMGTVVAA